MDLPLKVFWFEVLYTCYNPPLPPPVIGDLEKNVSCSVWLELPKTTLFDPACSDHNADDRATFDRAADILVPTYAGRTPCKTNTKNK